MRVPKLESQTRKTAGTSRRTDIGERSNDRQDRGRREGEPARLHQGPVALRAEIHLEHSAIRQQEGMQEVRVAGNLDPAAGIIGAGGIGAAGLPGMSGLGSVSETIVLQVTVECSNRCDQSKEEGKKNEGSKFLSVSDAAKGNTYIYFEGPLGAHVKPEQIWKKHNIDIFTLLLLEHFNIEKLEKGKEHCKEEDKDRSRYRLIPRTFRNWIQAFSIMAIVIGKKWNHRDISLWMCNTTKTSASSSCFRGRKGVWPPPASAGGGQLANFLMNVQDGKGSSSEGRFLSGFGIPFQEGEWGGTDCNNLRSARDFPEVVREKLEREICLGRMSGPFTESPIANL
ncbi:hypothetical protein XELAEV_18037165mg [Xenopus laevis]|uniref:Uncharacterized protein n=1 Tax=Xenopus laevis TaxID=8355 RepID=A0A974CBT7_XENLA|nr:hypothetical protein XELAEV_18037165mg [Xenopus laevis]